MIFPSIYRPEPIQVDVILSAIISREQQCTHRKHDICLQFFACFYIEIQQRSTDSTELSDRPFDFT